MPRPSPRTAIAAGLAVATAGVWWWATQDEPSKPNGYATDAHVEIEGVGDTSAVYVAPELDGRRLPTAGVITTQDGQTPFADLQGPLVVNVWASTCVPCRDEMPALQAFAEEYAGKVTVVGVDPLDGAGDLADFADELGITYPLYRDPDGVFQVELGIELIPATLFVRADGTIAQLYMGALDQDSLAALVASELGVR